MTARDCARAWLEAGPTSTVECVIRALLAEADALQQTTDDLEATYTQQASDLRGQVAAEDKREQDAGLKCGVLWEESGCDWPDTVAERVLHLRKERDALAAALDKYGGHAAGCALDVYLSGYCTCDWDKERERWLKK